MEPIIRTEKLTKCYGKNRGILDLSMEIDAGEVFGFLGPNGAGKTTTIRTLLDFIRPSSGHAEIFGLDSHRDAITIHKDVSYLPGDLALYPSLNGEQTITYFSSLSGYVDWPWIHVLAERLDFDLTRPVQALSSGNRQKLGVILALMGRPKLALLDEPTKGLDPLIQQIFYSIMRELKESGTTFFLSSHNLPEVERVCDRVGIIREGSLVKVETIAQLKAKALRRIEIYFDQNVDVEEFSRLDGVINVVAHNERITCTVQGSIDAVLKHAAKHTVLNLVSHEPSLEEAFMTFYTGEVEDVR